MKRALNRLHRIWLLLSLASICACAQSAGGELSLSSFDRNCGQPGKNCRAAFQQALLAIKRAGGGTIQLPAGTFNLDFPELEAHAQASNMLNSNSLIVIPRNTTIRGQASADGTVQTIIEWRETSVPLFVMPDSSNSTIQNLHFRFTGVTPHQFPYGDTSLLKALNIQSTFPHTNAMAGGNYEMFSVFYMFGSDHCKFDNLIFDSQTRDNDHVLGIALEAKGRHVYIDPVNGGGGLYGLSDGNQYTKIRLLDYVMGMVFSGQQNLVVNGITADRRGSTMDIAPGHVIYFTAEFKYSSRSPTDATTVFGQSKNVTVSNIHEGSSTYSNVHSGGTLALKYLDGGSFQDIYSEHPVGLIQALNNAHNLSFKNLEWSSDYHLCDNAPQDVCRNPIINSVDPDKTHPTITNLTFENIKLKSTVEPISCAIMGDHVSIKDLTIESPPTFKKGQTNTTAILSVSGADDVSISGYRYYPVITHFDNKAQANRPFICFSPCQNVRGDVEVHWPKAVPTPPAQHNAITPAFQNQDKDSTKQINVVTKIVPR